MFEKLKLRSVFACDQQLPELRRMYLSLSSSHRQQFREWLNDLSEAVKAQPIPDLRLAVQIVIDNTEVDDEGKPFGNHDAQFKPALMLCAIAEWDKGNDYAPEFNDLL